MFWYTEETRRLAKEHEATKVESARLLDWYQEVKAMRDVAPDDHAKAAHQATLRTIGRAISSAEQRQNAAFEAVYHSAEADQAAYVETPQGKARDSVLSLMQLKRGQTLDAANRNKLQQEERVALKRARFDLLVQEQPLGHQPTAAADPDSLQSIPGALLVPCLVRPRPRRKDDHGG